MYRIEMYRIEMYRIISYRIVSYRIVLYHIISNRIVSYRIVSYCIVSYHIASYRIVSHRTLMYRIDPKRILLQKEFQPIVHAIVSRTLNGSGIIHALELMTLNAMMGNYLWPSTKDGFLVLTAFSHSLASFYCTY